jgi:hypothetical protein
MAGGSFELRPVGPYSFGASVRFLKGFAPAAYEGVGSGTCTSLSSPTVVRR